MATTETIAEQLDTQKDESAQLAQIALEMLIRGDDISSDFEQRLRENRHRFVLHFGGGRSGLFNLLTDIEVYNGLDNGKNMVFASLHQYPGPRKVWLKNTAEGPNFEITLPDDTSER